MLFREVCKSLCKIIEIVRVVILFQLSIDIQNSSPLQWLEPHFRILLCHD